MSLLSPKIKNPALVGFISAGVLAVVIFVGYFWFSHPKFASADELLVAIIGQGIKIGSGVQITASYIPSTPACASTYAASPSWTKTVTGTIVRDIAGAYNATVTKDIFCDNTNCILYTSGATPSTTVCIATDANVYANILWSKTDVTSQTWADSNFSISGGDIGGTHGSPLTVGNGNQDVASKNWLARDYTSASGTFNAMDACKALGAGWRLPNILELDSIRDQGAYVLFVTPASRLPNILFYGSYWSSSENNGTYSWYLNFMGGTVVDANKNTSDYVRCVRGAM